MRQCDVPEWLFSPLRRRYKRGYATAGFVHHLLETVYAGGLLNMNRTKAIVTLAIGDRYLRHWKHTCEANWRAYAARHDFDVICIDKPLDDSERARKRSPAWQKCLVLSQEFSQRY